MTKFRKVRLCTDVRKVNYLLFKNATRKLLFYKEEEAMELG